MPPNISICIPTFNQPDSLRKCLDSIKSQEYKDFEVIITDDTRDNSVRLVCQEFSQSFKLKYSKNKRPLGAPDNWNKALELSSGQYIKFMFHDDIFYGRDSLRNFVNLLATNPESNFAFSASLGMAESGKIIFTRSAKRCQIEKLKSDAASIFPGNFIGVPSATIFRKEADVKFDKNLQWVVDLYFYYSILRTNCNFNFTFTPLVAVTSGSQSQLTSKCENNKKLEIYEWFYIFNKIEHSTPNSFQNFSFFWKLLNKYNIRSATDLINCGVDFNLPNIVEYIIGCHNIFKFLLKYRFSHSTLRHLCFFIYRLIPHSRK